MLVAFFVPRPLPDTEASGGGAVKPFHHGGAGTTGASLRAGVPSLVVPFTMDQPFWGARVAALGVGPRPIPRAGLTRARLAEGLRATQRATIRANASALGERIRAEDGVAAAVPVLEGMVR